MKFIKVKYIIYGLFIMFFGIFTFYAYSIWRQDSKIKNFRIDYYNASNQQKKAVFAKYFNDLGPIAILDFLEDEFPLCHSQAHDLGKVIMVNTQDLNQAIAICRARCNSGCFHGLLMEFFKDIAKEKDEAFRYEHGLAENDDHLHIEINDIKDKVNEICNTADVLSHHRAANCVHAMGHAFEFLSDYDIEGGLKLCELYSNKILEYYCVSGVFMERDIQFGREDLRKQSRLYPCDEYSEFPAACYRYKVQQLKYLSSASELKATCQSLNGFHRLGCFHGLGLAYIDLIGKDPKKLALICNSDNTNDQKTCIEGAIESLAEHDEKTAYQACGYLNGELKDLCQDSAARKYYSTNKDFSLYFKR